MKKRTGGHEKTIREYDVSSSGIRIGEPLDDFRGVLTGAPEYTGRKSGAAGS
jgi:circadian clock protein KaiC